MRSLVSSSSLVDTSLHLIDGFRQVHLRDDTKAFRASLSEEHCGALLEELGAVHKSEFNSALVSSSHERVVHFDNLGRLSDDSTMDHSLVVLLDGGGVLQDNNLSFKVEDGNRLSSLVNEDHTLAEMVSLELLLLRLDREAHCLTSFGDLYIDPLVVDRFNLYGFELALLVRTEQKDIGGSDGSTQHGTSNDETHTSDLIDAIDEELDGIVSASELSRLVYTGLYQRQELFELGKAYSGDVRNLEDRADGFRSNRFGEHGDIVIWADSDGGLGRLW